MRNGISLVVIFLALASIVAGYVSGQTVTHPPPTVALHAPGVTAAILEPDRAATDGAVDDLFSQDDVVVERPLVTAPTWLPERLEVVVGLCGRSVAVESRFLELGAPLAFDLDPNAAEAVKFARLVRGVGDKLFVHLDRAPSTEELVTLRERIGEFDGVAARNPAGMARALAGTGLGFFDERGDADPKPFSSAGVELVRRDVTVDNRSASTYVTFMLARAADRSTRAGAIVALMRPLPNSLAALSQFTHARTIELAAVR